MRSNHVITLVVAISLGLGLLVFAGCGGGSKKSVAPVNEAKASGKQTTRTSEDDCTSLSHIPDDLALAGTGFDYVRTATSSTATLIVRRTRSQTRFSGSATSSTSSLQPRRRPA